MSDSATLPAAATAAAGAPAPVLDRGYRYRHALESILVPALALAFAAAGFALFLICLGQSPLDFVDLVWRGAFGSTFSIQNTLLKASPLLLTALCVALPAQLGLVIIGGEGAVVLGGLAAAAIAPPLNGIPPLLLQVLMMIAGMSAGAVWIGFAGWLRAKRGINETISSLLLAYIAIALFNHIVEGPLRDPASLNKPSTADIGAPNMFGYIPGTDVHPGLIFGIIACIAFYILIFKTSFGFGCRVTGGSLRAAQLQGLPVTRLIIIACALGGACAGLAGMVEVAAVQGSANANIAAGYGLSGILVAFLARQHPLAVIPVAILLGGIGASGGLLQRRLDLPDAAVLVLQGILFVALLAGEGLPPLREWKARISR